MRIAVTGIWHQGMVLAAALAELGHTVVGVPASAADAEQLSAAEPLVHEPELADRLAASLASARLAFTTSVAEAVAGAEVVFLSVDTPVDAQDRPELGPVLELAREIGAGLTGDCILCVTAQVEVGASERLRAIVRETSGREVGLAYVPEFLRLGEAVETFRAADRFVVGCDEQDVAARVTALFEPLGRPVVQTSVATAEVAKHASNAFLATSISFANELADLCEAVGADAAVIGQILRLDTRIGLKAYLTPGVGFAGATLGRDVRTLQALGAEHGIPTHLANAVMAINDERMAMVVRRLERELAGLDGRRVALIGLAYKAGTDTLRRALSLELAAALHERGAVVTGFDPLARVSDLSDPPPLEQRPTLLAAAAGCDALVVLVGLPELESLDLFALEAAMRGDLVLDTTGRLPADAALQAGLRLLTTGRGA